MLQYEILPGTGSEKFRMNSDNGELTTAVSLDRETQEFFSIKGNSVKYLWLLVKWEVRMDVVLPSSVLSLLAIWISWKWKYFQEQESMCSLHNANKSSVLILLKSMPCCSYPLYKICFLFFNLSFGSRWWNSITIKHSDSYLQSAGWKWLLSQVSLSCLWDSYSRESTAFSSLRCWGCRYGCWQ